MKSLHVRIPLLSIAILLLLGCVAGQSLEMDYQAESKELSGEPRDISFILSVDDMRPYIISGEKPRYYIGKYRAGFGIPYDVSTDGDIPLANLLSRDMTKELSNLGFSKVNSASDRRLQFTIHDWNFDTYQNGTFSYSIEVKVFDTNDIQLIQTKVEGNEFVKGTFWTGGKGGFERAMPGLYQGVITSLVRNNTEVLGALD